MNAVIQPNEKGYYIDDMPNDDYHKPENGFSTSTLKSFLKDPASIIWARKAPQNKDKLAAINFGTDFHTYFLEPDQFKKHYKVLPVFNRRIKAEKDAEQELIKQWKDDGVIAVTSEDMDKLESMRLSALAHPTVNAIMSMNGIAERSYFWKDPKTDVLCKCRPDWLVLDITDKNRPAFMPKDCNILIADVKSVADIERTQSQIENLKYYIQDPFYSRGVSLVEGGKVCFVFIFVSTSLSLGRHQVQVAMLDEVARFDGRNEITEGLARYAQWAESDDDSVWQTVVTIDRPSWATREESIFD